MSTPDPSDMDARSAAIELARAQLESVLHGLFPEHREVQLLAFHELSAGWESDVYGFDVALDGVRERRVLRIYPGNEAGPKSALEYRALRELGRAGYPVPVVYTRVQEGSPFSAASGGEGRPFLVMEWVPGHGIWRDTFHGPEAQRQILFERFCTLLVQHHALDWQAFVPGGAAPAAWGSPEAGDAALGFSPYAFVDEGLRLLPWWIEQMAQFGYLPIVDWLAQRRDAVPCRRPAPIHWDFHPENILLCDDGRAVVIDWTQFQVSDPRYDLAWTMTLVGGQEGDDVRERILRRYESLSGQQIDQIEVFEVFACTKRLASVTFSLAAGAAKLGMRSGAEESMRRNFPALRQVYARLQHLTGLSIPEVDSVLAG